MIVYVESNFVLELALQQEEHAACEQLLWFAEKTRLHLVIPAFSLAEPFSTLSRRHSERRRLKAEFDRELGQLARSVDHAKRLRSFRELTALLVDSADSDTERLESVRSRLLDVADVVPLDRPILREANILREEHDLSPPDSLVLASVLTYLETSGGPKYFANKDRRDFGEPGIRSLLEHRGCRLFASFQRAMAHLTSRLATD